MFLLWHPWLTTTNFSYSFPILKLPPPPCAVLLVFYYQFLLYIYIIYIYYIILYYIKLNYIILYHIISYHIILYYIITYCIHSIPDTDTWQVYMRVSSFPVCDMWSTYMVWLAMYQYFSGLAHCAVLSPSQNRWNFGARQVCLELLSILRLPRIRAPLELQNCWNVL